MLVVLLVNRLTGIPVAAFLDFGLPHFLTGRRVFWPSVDMMGRIAVFMPALGFVFGNLVCGGLQQCIRKGVHGRIAVLLLYDRIIELWLIRIIRKQFELIVTISFM